jgi:hypothetical protein|tara:strand:- start:17 stop:214 length:198 start_codon:yes stop_codon:yes gene_type:complete
MFGGVKMDEKKNFQEDNFSSGSRLNLNVLLKRLKQEQNAEKKYKILATSLLIFILSILGLFFFIL